MRHDTIYGEIRYEDRIRFKDDLLKPLHLYAYKIVAKPEKIANDVYRQACYSEYAIFFKGEDEIIMKSRPATPQFQEINNPDLVAPSDCFKTLFAWYCPWFIDLDTTVEFVQPDVEDYPFYMPEQVKVNFKNRYQEPRVALDPVWIPFFVKRESKAIKETYGKIERLTPVYDMVIR
jgi:hypothetical protein